MGPQFGTGSKNGKDKEHSLSSEPKSRSARHITYNGSDDVTVAVSGVEWATLSILILLLVLQLGTCITNITRICSGKRSH